MKIKHLLTSFGLALGTALVLLCALGSRNVGPKAALAAALALSGPSQRTCWVRLNDDPTDYTTVQAAVDAAEKGDTVKVAGYCTGVESRPRQDVYTTGVVTQVVYISKTVTVRGGYTTTNWTTPDPEVYPTTLDAGGEGRVLYVTGEVSPTIEGLYITGGDATGQGGGESGYAAGGGVYVYTATATISGCVVYSNTASTANYGYGGGLTLCWSDATLEGNVVQGNTASTAYRGLGGGLYLSAGDAILRDNEIVSNTASTAGYGYGGGLDLYSSDATLEGNIVQGNTASTASYGEGGGLCLSYGAVTLVSNTVQGNTASTAGMGFGGGLFLSLSDAILQDNAIISNTASTAGVGYGGGLHLYWSDDTLEGNTVQGNIASTAADGIGGGLSLYESNATLKDNLVQGNTAGIGVIGGGGGLFLSSSDATLWSNTVIHNTASTADDGYGGGLSLYRSAVTFNGNAVVSNTATLNPTATGQGGGLWIQESSSFTLTNNLVIGNHANTQGGGLWFGSSLDVPTSGRLRHTTIADNHNSGIYMGISTTLAFTNTIIAGHSHVGITVTAGSTATLEATLWHGNGANTGGGGTILTGTVNVYDAPAFVNPAVWDYHLDINSPAIDAGVDAGVADDIDGHARPLGIAPDLGADEVTTDNNAIYLPLVMHNWHPPVLAFLSKIHEPLPSWFYGGAPAVAENRLFSPLDTRGLAIYDIGDPLSPRLLARLNVAELGGQAKEVAASGDRAFVSLQYPGTIAMVDLSDPEQPKVVRTFGDIPNMGRLALRGDLLYVQANSGSINNVYYSGGVHVFDTRPDPPINTGSYLQRLTDPGFHVTDEGTVFIARTPAGPDDFPGIDVVDMSDPANPELIGQWVASCPGNIVDIDLADDHLFMAAYWGGLWILDATNLANMAQVAFYDWESMEPYALSVAALPPFVFLAQGGPGLSLDTLDIFRYGAEGVVVEREIVTGNSPTHILLDNDLVILQEYAQDEEIIRLYRITDSLAGSLH